MATSYHMVHYRKCILLDHGGGIATFEMLCRQALGQQDAQGTTLWQRAQDRVFSFVNDADGRQIVLNKVADLSTAIFGEMCLVQSHGLQGLLEQQASQVKLSNITVAEIFALQEQKAPAGSQFIRGMIYWLVIGDHLFFVKTQSMTADNLVGYANWLLKTRTATLRDPSAIKVQAEFDKSQVSGDIGEIKSLRMSGRAAPLAATPVSSRAPDTRPTARKISDRVVEMAQAIPVVKALFGAAKTESLVDSLGPDEYLTVDATVKVRGRRTENSRAQMSELANDLADLTDGKVQIEGKDGKLSDDDAILRTRMPFQLVQEGSNFLDFDNVADQLQEVYSRFVRDGKIGA